MATLALAAAGAAAGSAMLPAGISVLGATISGATIGSQIGALAGRAIDASLFASSGQSRTFEGPRLRDLHVTASSEGAAIPRVYGRARLGGQVIWATDFEEVAVSTTSSSGGSGKGGGGGGGATTTSVEYRYYANFAVAICEGAISSLGRVWADGNELDLGQLSYRLYTGSETQAPDSLIVAHVGADNAPAFRGVAYIVFERLALAPFGNRMPQLSFEVHRPVETFSSRIRGVVLIPGSGEFALSPSPVSHVFAGGVSEAENVHTRQGGSDWSVALDQMQAELPGVASVSLVTSWFGTDLCAGSCQLMPGVELRDKKTSPETWAVAGLTRANAHLVSQKDGRPAYGGTPSDASVVAAIRDLQARGLGVTLNPFVMMDIAVGNALPNPYGGASQPAYPWRGRITVHPASGQPGTAEKTAAAAAQVATFLGTAQPSHFSLSGDAVAYSGPAEWSYRRMILHYAYLAKAAGGCDAFLIGSELRGLTTARSNTSTYPFVAGLMQLASDVKAVLGPACKVVYAADWSEYFGHQPSDGSGDVYFHLDPLWASASIDAIGIDLYWPLADWRDGASHRDALDGVRSPYDGAYLKRNVTGGEGYDWYYASEAARDAQSRTPITDGAGKPWVFRYKDLKAWWGNAHHDRPGGTESAAPTAWMPESKPFWLMETGCPAVDKGGNQPNVFVDPKSVESALPYYSRGTRDDLMQRAYLRALIESFDPAAPGFSDAVNPVSAVYGGRMVASDRIHVYCWDARPFPAFPYNTDAWGDGPNWRLGHWITGRMGAAPLAETVARILDDYDFADHEAGGLTGTLDGYVIDRIMSPREALQSLELAFFFDSLETGARIVFRQRGAEPPAAVLARDDLVETRPDDALMTLTRAQETELPASAKIKFISGSAGYAEAVAEARRLAGASGRVAQADLPIVMEPEAAARIADTWLFEAWAARESASFTLPPSLIALEPGDAIEVDTGSGARLLRITEIGDHGARDVGARGLDADVYGVPPAPFRPGRSGDGSAIGSPWVELLDLPLLGDDQPAQAGWAAAVQAPWPGGVAVYASPETAGYVLRGIANAPAVIGTTLDPLYPGAVSRFDRATRLKVVIASGTVSSVSELQLLSGRNAAAVRNADGEWEVIQFATATLVSDGVYELSDLLRGQAGTEGAMRSPVLAGATFVLLDQGLARLDVSLAELGLPLSWRYGPSSRDIGDASYATQTHAFTGLGLRPLSPVHARAVRAGGDIALSWIRRTRIGGDSWEAAEVPLGEESERYEVDIVDGGGAVKRTLACMAPAVTYTSAEQIADFGATQAQLHVRIAQVSAVRGRGPALPATV